MCLTMAHPAPSPTACKSLPVAPPAARNALTLFDGETYTPAATGARMDGAAAAVGGLPEWWAFGQARSRGMSCPGMGSVESPLTVSSEDNG